ncbi:MAG: hypothetical protein HC869_08650 [Rhodospirillales bacterium]|nr:hypothetical protein [Rhodospirillales bacterium]
MRCKILAAPETLRYEALWRTMAAAGTMTQVYISRSTVGDGMAWAGSRRLRPTAAPER